MAKTAKPEPTIHHDLRPERTAWPASPGRWRGALTGPLGSAKKHFLKVTASYGPGLFWCYFTTTDARVKTEEAAKQTICTLESRFKCLIGIGLCGLCRPNDKKLGLFVGNLSLCDV
jgi:hypothetical protein